MAIRASDYLLLLHFDNNFNDSSTYGNAVTCTNTGDNFRYRSGWGYRFMAAWGIFTTDCVKNYYFNKNGNYILDEFVCDFQCSFCGTFKNYFLGSMFYFTGNGSTAQIYMKDVSTGTYSMIVNGIANAWNWNHILLSYKDNSLYIYLNGSRVYSFNPTISLENDTFLINIDSSTGSGAGTWLDEYRFLTKCTDEYRGDTITVPTAPYTLPENTYVFRPWLFQNQIISN